MDVVLPYVENLSEVQTIFEFTPYPMWIYDLETYRFLKVNREAIRTYGYSEEEFLNKTIKDIRPTEDVPRLEKAVEQAWLRKVPYKEGYYRHKKCDGTVMHVKIKSNLINYGGRKAEIVSAIDLSKYYEQEQKIKLQKQNLQLQKKYLEVIDRVNQLMIKAGDWLDSLTDCFKIIGQTLDVDRIYFFQNNSEDLTTSQKIEWVRSEIVPQINNAELQNVPLAEFPLFMEPLMSRKPFEAIVEELETSPTKNILAKQDIKSILIIPIWLSEEFCGFVGFDDCTQKRTFSEEEYKVLHALTTNLGQVIKRQEAFNELAAREAKFKSLIENGKDLIAILDEKGNYKYVAPTSETVLGVTAKDFLNRNVFEFIADEDIPRLEQCFVDIFETEYVSIAPYRFRDAKGKWRWLRTELTNHLKTPLINGIVANTHEVTQEVERRMADAIVASITLALGKVGSLAECLNKALNCLVKIPKISVSEVWLLSPDGKHLNLIAKACQQKRFGLFYEHSKDITSVVPSKGILGEVWSQQSTVLWKDLPKNTNLLRSTAAEKANLNTAIGLPIIFNSEFLGCIVCFSEYEEDELVEQIALLKMLSDQLGAIIKQKITDEEYKNFFEISPDPHCILGFDGRIKKSNIAFNDLIGYREEDIINQPIFKFIYEDDLEKSKERFNNALNGNKNNTPIEVRYLSKTGEIKWLVWKASVIPESKVFVAAAKNITEQKLAEKELRQAYIRLKNAQKIAKLGYWIKEFNSDLSVMSDETYKIYELSPENFVPTMDNIAKLFHPDDRYLIESNPTEILEPGKVKSFEHRIITGLGKMRWVREEIKLIYNDQGEPLRMEGTIQDITERKEYEEQLKQSNERFKLAIKVSNEVIWKINHEKGTIIRGDNYLNNFDYKDSESFTKNSTWFSKMHHEDKDWVWNSLNDTFKNKDKTSWRGEYRIIGSDGTIRYFIDRCSIIRDIHGKPIRTIGSARDITDSKQQLEKIKKQNENLRDIAWLQSHVIRSPLSKIMGLINLYKELDGGGVTHEEIMDMIMESANELDKVIFEITEKINALKDEETRNSTDR